ncbi:MAG TPA: hypothetical protein VLH39_06705 [Magnetospirillaceae bacterium]|nr:hypothetical protein [Magnetospirillaceae bacterium]
MTILDSCDLSLSPRETIELYRYLKRSEETMPSCISSVLAKLEERLYSRLSIEEMENLEVYLGMISAAEAVRR